MGGCDCIRFAALAVAQIAIQIAIHIIVRVSVRAVVLGAAWLVVLTIGRSIGIIGNSHQLPGSNHIRNMPNMVSVSNLFFCP